MSPALTRRRVVQAAGAALGSVVAPIAASAAAATATGPDAELGALLDAFTAARDAWDASAAPYAAAEQRAKDAYPPRPDALWLIGLDLTIALPAPATGRMRTAEGERRCFYRADDIERLRGGPPVTRWSITGDDTPATEREPDPKGEARRQAIVAAHDGWMRDCGAVEDAVGFTVEREAADAAADALTAAERALTDYQPRTVAGLVRKAAWVADEVARERCADGLAELFTRQVAAFAQASA